MISFCSWSANLQCSGSEPDSRLGEPKDDSRTADLLASGLCWEETFKNSPLPSLITERDTGRCVAVNDEMLNLLGLGSDEALGRSTIALKFWSDEQQRAHMLRMLGEQGSLKQYEFNIQLKDGKRTLIGNIKEICANGQMLLVHQFMDITARTQLEEKLRVAAAAVAHAGEGLVLLSAKGEIISVNPAFTRITGYQEEEARGIALDELMHRPTKRHDNLFFRRIAGSLALRGHWEGQAWARRKNGTDFPAFLTLNAIRSNGARAKNYVAVFSDISKQREYEERLEQLALWDCLTGLANRTLLKKRIERALTDAKRHGRQLAVLFADLNRFKEVNDVHGHAVGDELLKRVAQRLLGCVRATDTVARLGGDEFVVLLPQLDDPGHLSVVVKKITTSIEQPFSLNGLTLRIGVTVGVARYPSDGYDMAALLRHADEDLYRRKPAGLR